MSVFITFEGGDGSGKSTQAELLSKFLEDNDFDVFMTHEPGGTNYGEMFRHLLLETKSKNYELDVRAQVLGFCSTRAQLVSEHIIPRLNMVNTITISDRFADSTIAYQVYGGEALELKEEVEELLNFATYGIKPNLTIFLDVLPVDGKKRIEGRIKKEEEPHAFGKEKQLTFLEDNDYDKKTLHFHESVRKGYYSLIEQEPIRWSVVDGNRPIDEIQSEIREYILSWLSQKEVHSKTQKNKKNIRPSDPSNEHELFSFKEHTIENNSR